MIVPFKLSNKKFIFIDLETRIQVFNKMEYDFAYPFKNGFAKIKVDGKYGLISSLGEIVVPIIYNDIADYNENFVLVQLNDFFGIYSTDGSIVIPIKYKNLENVSENLILFAHEEDLYKKFNSNISVEYGFLNLNSEVVINPSFTPAESFSEGLAVVGKYCGMDEDYCEVIKYGFIDKMGNLVIPYDFDYAYSFKNGIAHVKKDDKWFYIDKQGQTESMGKAIEAEHSLNSHKNLTPFRKLHNLDFGHIETFGYKDKLGRIAISPVYTSANEFEEGLALVSIHQDYFYILPTGEELYHRTVTYG